MKLYCEVHVQVTSLFKKIIGIRMFKEEANFCYY